MNLQQSFLTVACAAGMLATTSQDAVATFVGPSNLPGGTSQNRATVNWNQPLPAPIKKAAAPNSAAGAVRAAGAPTLAFAPSTIASDFRGYVDVQISGLNSGETVRLEKFQVNNTAGTVDGSALLVESLLLTDGQGSVIGGVANPNVTSDLTGENGAIVAQLSFLDAFLPSMSGEYVFRLSSPANRFASLTTRFTVTPAPAAQQVSGTVTAGGTNVPFAHVALFDVDGGSYDFVAGAVADAQGAYTIPAPPGSYHLVSARPGFVGGFDEGATRVQLAAGVHRTKNPVLTAGTRTITGRLSDAANPAVGLPGVEVLLRNKTQTKFALAYTDADGNWSAPVTPDKWEIEILAWSVTQIGFVGLRVPVFANTTAASVSNVTLRLPRAEAIIRGTVADAGSPLPYVDVLLYNQNFKYWLTVSTDEDGKYVAAVSTGVWQVRLDAASLDGLGHAGVVSGFVPISSGQVATVDFAPRAIITQVEGSVVDDHAEPVPGVAFTMADSGLTYVAGEADESGDFSLQLPNGTFHFEIALETLAGLGLIDVQAPPVVATGVPIPGMELKLKSPTAHLTVHAKDQFGRRISDLPLLATARIEGQQHRSFDFTDENGEVSLPVIDGAWTLQLEGADAFLKLEPQGYATTTNRMISVAGSNVTYELTLDVILPRMAITHLSGNTVKLTWTTPLSGLDLESNANPASPWLPVERGPVYSNESYSITLPVTEPSRYFRLSRP